MFRLLKNAKSLRVLFNTLVVALPALGNVSLLIFLIMFVYAVMGMQLFGHVMWGDIPNYNVNFETFWASFVVTVRVTVLVALISCNCGRKGFRRLLEFWE